MSWEGSFLTAESTLPSQSEAPSKQKAHQSQVFSNQKEEIVYFVCVFLPSIRSILPQVIQGREREAHGSSEVARAMPGAHWQSEKSCKAQTLKTDFRKICHHFLNRNHIKTNSFCVATIVTEWQFFSCGVTSLWKLGFKRKMVLQYLGQKLKCNFFMSQLFWRN